MVGVVTLLEKDFYAFICTGTSMVMAGGIGEAATHLTSVCLKI